MIEDQKILMTGAAGRVGFPIARKLVENNQVYAVGRFTDESDRVKLEKIGVKCIRKDLGLESCDDLPNDFTYVFNAAVVFSRAVDKKEELERDWAYALEVNALSVGRLMYHTRNARGFFHCSTSGVYQYQGHQPLTEDSTFSYSSIRNPKYTLSKMMAESVVRFASRQWEIPTTIARLFWAYGPEGGWLGHCVESVLQQVAYPLNPDKPNFCNPIYEDDYVELAIRGMIAANVPPLIVNWSSSETVSVEEICEYIGKLLGVAPRFAYNAAQPPLLVPDVTLMHSVLGKSRIHWRDGVRNFIQSRYPALPLTE